MATINFLYRSARNEAPLNLRLLFTHDEKPHVIGGKTKTIVSKDYWENTHNGTRINDIELKNHQTEIKTELLKLENYILNKFDKTNIEEINKDWLSNQIESYYNPVKAVKIPNRLIPFIDYYLNVKGGSLSNSRVQIINTVKKKIERFENDQQAKFKIIDVNDDFKNSFVDYSKKEQYSISTIVRDVKTLKTICLYAESCGLEIHKQLKSVTIKEELKQERAKSERNFVTLNNVELEQLKALDLSSNKRLDNVRDWFFISYYTAQRISDFMRFNASMIVVRGGKRLLEFKQKKVEKLITIAFVDKAQEIINKNNGEFPRSISHAKYNDYLKELCKLAGIDKLMEGTILESTTTAKKKKRHDYRRTNGTFEKWRLISSHVGRRSFATNFYGKVPTSVLIEVTGHSTESMFLEYIHKSDDQKAIDRYKYFG